MALFNRPWNYLYSRIRPVNLPTATTASGDIVGTASGIATLTAVLIGLGALVGTSTGSGDQTGALTGSGALVATSAGTTTVSGSIVGAGALIATSAGSTTLSGTLVGAGALAGTSAGVATCTATATQPTITGTSDGVATCSGTLTGTGALVATSAGSASSSANLTGAAPLVGTSAGSASQTGALLGAGALAGTSAGLATLSGSLGSDGSLTGTSAGTTSTSAVLTGKGALVSSSAGTGTVSGTISGYGPSMAAAGTSTVSGTLVGKGALSGTSTGTCTVSGTMDQGYIIDGQESVTVINAYGDVVLYSDGHGKFYTIHRDEDSGSGDTDDQTAAEVTYDNIISGLTATNVQDALDELNGDIGSIVAGAGNLTPDSHPSSPNAIDDEFEDTALDAKWAWRNQGSATATLSYGSLVLFAPGGASTSLRGIEQNISGSFLVRTKIKAYSDPSNYATLSIYAANNSSGKIMSIGWNYTGGNKLEGLRYDNATTFNSSIIGPTDIIDESRPAASPPMYFGLENTGTQLRGRYSYDGIIWTLVFNEDLSDFIGSIDRVGLFANSENNIDTYLVSDWFRRIS